MKTIAIFCAVLGLALLSHAQTLPELDEEGILACIMQGIEEVREETEAFARWVVETVESVWRLFEQYRRCQEMTNERLQQACMASWTASVLFEGLRLRNDLARITSEENADLFRDNFLACFGVEDDGSHLRQF